MFTHTLRLVALAGFCISIMPAQTQGPTTRDFCVKVQPGKGAEYAAMLHDVSAKLAQVTVDSGGANWWLAARAVVPVGTAARCDYHIVSGYLGFPPEGVTPAQTDADLRKANINMTAAELGAKRGSLTTVANLDIWQALVGVGRAQKGNYLRMNLYKARPGQLAEWIKLEREGWKPFAEARAKETPGSGWLAAALLMPGGESLHYNALTIDVFPNWAAMGAATPVTTLWPKVHADLPFNTYMDQVGKTAERYRTEVYQVVEMVQGK